MIAIFSAYTRERLRPAVFAPAIVLLTFAALWGSGFDEPPLVTAAAALSLMAALVLQFRLFDDLEDRDRDRIEHPGRVLVTHSAVPFCVVLALLVVLSGAIAAAVAGPRGVWSIVALDVAAVLLYRVARTVVPVDAWPIVLVAVKYPALVAAVATAIGAPDNDQLLLACLTTSVGACVFELTHARPTSAGVPS